MNKRYGGKPLPVDDVNFEVLPFDIEKIDSLIEDKLRNFSIIIENKINYAVDQDRQVERYIDSVNMHGVPVKSIYVIYLTRDGSKKISSKSLTKKAKTDLCYTDENHGRFIEMNYRDDILPWLREDVLNNIKVKDVLLLGTVNLYINYLEKLLEIRTNEEKISRIMQKEIANILDISGKSLTDSWKILNENYNNLESLKDEIFKMREEREKEVIDSWDSISKKYWPNCRNEISNKFYQLFFDKPVSNNIHFEWKLPKENLFQLNRLEFELHTEGQEKIYYQRLHRNDAFKNEAVNLGFNLYNDKKEITVISKSVEIPNGHSFSELTEADRDNFIKEFYNSLRNLTNIIVSSYNLLDDEVEITSELKERMEEETGRKWGLWPELNAWDLVRYFNKNSHCIGIESSFSVNGNQEPEYRIYITVWDKKNWDVYEDELRKVFKDAFDYKLDKDQGNRVYLHIPPIKIAGERDEWFSKIVDKLTEVYGKMKEITDRIK